MKVLNKFTIKNLKLNKKRTAVTIIGIMLSTALICGVAGLVSSFQQTLINATIQSEGNYHTTFYNVEKDKLKYITNNEKVEQYFMVGEVGWANLEGSQNVDKPYLNIFEYDNKALENYGITLVEGRVPTNSSEILISEHIRTNGRVDLKVGDTITIDVGKRVLADGTELDQYNPYLAGTEVDGEILEERIIDAETKTYTIVGIMERLNSEEYSSPGYTVITCMENIGDTVNISALYKNPKECEEINESICESTGTEEMTVNSELLRWQGVFSDGAMEVLYAIAAVVIVIIVISSVFVIRNSFSISVSEKNRQYGMLASIGATSKQIKRNVVFEGMVIGLIAVPLGILLGVVAIMILLQVVNYLIGDLLAGMKFVYSINIIPVLASVLISFITIYLSCLIPAKRAAKISPIESIRGNNDIKIKARKMKTPKLIKKVFGIGGVIASKNLKRSKKKYRTTVISIVVSIFIFISLSSFLSVGTKISTLYYTDYQFNIIVARGDKEQYEEIVKLENVDKYAYYYQTSLNIDFNRYATEFGKEYYGDTEEAYINVIVYNNEYFKEYVKELGLKEEEYKTAAILIDEIIMYNEDDSKTVGNIYNIKSGDKITVKDAEEEKNITITKRTDKKPMGIEGSYYDTGIIVVSEEYIKEAFGEEKLDENYYIDALYIQTEESEDLENQINDLIKENIDYTDLYVYNYEAIAEQQKRMILVIAIFLYGFITVISLIGVTNIFNTITTNMILRSKEFAMLKSIGMTTKEFNRMIRLESIMYGLKSLVIGIPLGLIGSYFIQKAFAMDIDLGYSFPLTAVIISIVFVFIIVGITMKYSLNKINKQNIIETIRKENI